MKLNTKRLLSRRSGANPGIIIVLVIVTLLFILALLKVVKAGGI